MNLRVIKVFQKIDFKIAISKGNRSETTFYKSDTKNF